MAKSEFKIFRDEPTMGAYGQYFYSSDFGDLYAGTGIGTIESGDDIYTTVEDSDENVRVLHTDNIAQCTVPDDDGNLVLDPACNILADDPWVEIMYYDDDNVTPLVDSVGWFNFKPSRNIDWGKFSFDFWQGYWTNVRPYDGTIKSGYDCHHDGWDDWDCMCYCDNGKGGDNIAECDDNNNGECFTSCEDWCDDYSTFSFMTVDDFRPIAYAYTGNDIDNGHTVQRYYDSDRNPTEHLLTSAPNVVKLQLQIAMSRTDCNTLYKNATECDSNPDCSWLWFDQSADVDYGTGVAEGICNGFIAQPDMTDIVPLVGQTCATSGCSEYEAYPFSSPAYVGDGSGIHELCDAHSFQLDNGSYSNCVYTGYWGAEWSCVVPPDVLESGIFETANVTAAIAAGLGDCDPQDNTILDCDAYSQFEWLCQEHSGDSGDGCYLIGTWNTQCVDGNMNHMSEGDSQCPQNLSYELEYTPVPCGVGVDGCEVIDEDGVVIANDCGCIPIPDNEYTYEACGGVFLGFCAEMYAIEQLCPTGFGCGFDPPQLDDIHVTNVSDCTDICVSGGDYCYTPTGYHIDNTTGGVCGLNGLPQFPTNPYCSIDIPSDTEAVCDTEYCVNGYLCVEEGGTWYPGDAGHCNNCTQDYFSSSACYNDADNIGNIYCCGICNEAAAYDGGDEDADGNNQACDNNGWASDGEPCIVCTNNQNNLEDYPANPCEWDNVTYKYCNEFGGQGHWAACGMVLNNVAGNQCDNCQYVPPGDVQYNCEREPFHCFNPVGQGNEPSYENVNDYSDRLVIPNCQKYMGFVVNWDWREGDPDTWDEIVAKFPRDAFEAYEMANNDDLYDYIDLAEMENRKREFSHQYYNYGVKTIKVVVFSYVENPDTHEVQAMRWKLVTIKIVLGIDDVYVEDFNILGGFDFNFLPWPRLCPVIGGISQESNYRKSVEKIYNSNLFAENEIIDKDLALAAYLNDELGTYPGKIDIAQVRVFGSGTFDMPKLLHIEQECSNILDVNSKFDWEPYGEYYPGDFNYNEDYWDGIINQFPQESSVGSLFIDEAIDSIREACLFEYNLGDSDNGTVRDSSGNNNTGVLIGDYAISKTTRSIPLQRDQSMKLPKVKTDNGAI